MSNVAFRLVASKLVVPRQDITTLTLGLLGLLGLLCLGSLGRRSASAALAGNVNNDMLPLDARGDHHTLLVLSSTQRIAGERRQSIGVERQHGGSL